MAKSKLRAFLVLAAAAWVPPAVLADEVVHFTNGAEMAVRTHTVEKDMVKLDLGSNSFIAFPMSMVDKIVSSGQDVFLNPTFHPANQAVSGVAGAGVAGTGNYGGGSPSPDNTIHGTGAPVGFVPQPGARGGAGVMLGEAADAQPFGNASRDEVGDVARLRTFNPAFPATPGSQPQVIMPAGKGAPGRMSFVAPPRTATPPPPQPQPQPPPPGQGDPSPQDPNND